jgi:hypothetical protein
MTAAPKFRIDVTINDHLTADHRPPAPAEAKGLSLPSPVFPPFPERVMESGPEAPPEKRKWGFRDIYRTYGKKILTIDHADYVVRAKPLEAESGR